LALYQEVGFARSLLAYEMPDGRLKLLDGHLRRDLDPHLEVDVEILNVTDEEARALRLSAAGLAFVSILLYNCARSIFLALRGREPFFDKERSTWD
jgi:hypothetical protein